MTTTNDTRTIWQRLQAAWSTYRGIPPQQESVKHPFFMWSGVGVGTGGRMSGTANKNVNPAKLRKFSESPIVRRLINYLRFSVASLAWDVEPLPGEKFNRNHKNAIKRMRAFLRQPNPDDTWGDWLGKMVDDMLVPGWGLSEIKRFDEGGEDTPFALWPVDGFSVEVDLDWSGSPKKPRYWQINTIDHRKPYAIPFRNSDLMVWKYVPRASTPFGLSPTESAYMEIAYLLEAQAFAGRTASNAQPKKLLWLKGLNSDQVNEVRDWARQTIDGSGVLPIGGGDGDATSVELGLVTDQNLFLQWQEFLIAVIADAFGIDVTKVNLIIGINRSTGDTLDDTTDAGAIEPLCTMIEQYMDKYVLPLFGLAEVGRFKFKFHTAVSDRKALASINQVELQADYATVDEAREAVGRSPLLHPVTGEPIGQMTLSAYRAAIKVPGFLARGMKALEEHAALLEEQAKVRTQQDDNEGAGREDEEFGKNENNGDEDPKKRGGNGVNSAPKIKEKAYNQRNDSAMEPD